MQQGETALSESYIAQVERPITTDTARRNARLGRTVGEATTDQGSEGSAWQKALADELALQKSEGAIENSCFTADACEAWCGMIACSLRTSN